MAISDSLRQTLERLRTHTDQAIDFPQSEFTKRHEHLLNQRMVSENSTVPCSLNTNLLAVKLQLTQHRSVRTTTSRVLEMDIREVIADHPLAKLAMRILFDRLSEFFMLVSQKRPVLLSPAVNLDKIQELRRLGNQRQHFHIIRELMGPIRSILRYLADTDGGTDASLMNELGRLGAIVPEQVHRMVANAVFGDTDQILSPPERLRAIWKPVGRQRMAKEDNENVGPYTQQLWRTRWRVRDCEKPSMSKYELESLFGPAASFVTHADERLPYECGANKFTVVEQDPFTVECTANGLHTTSGPSGTAYRYLNLWLVLGGARQKLPEMRFAMAALGLGGHHHSLVEVIAVCAPILGEETPSTVEAMVEALVAHDMELEWHGECQGISPLYFQRMLDEHLRRRLA
ncbi:MAG: hypothetical protein Q9219_004796 [cf. Caloplaca sp. 3 TL-2023]